MRIKPSESKIHVYKKMPDKNTGFGLVKGISNKEKKLKKTPIKQILVLPAWPRVR